MIITYYHYPNQLNNMELSSNARAVIRQEAGEDKFKVEINENKNDE